MIGMRAFALYKFVNVSVERIDGIFSGAVEGFKAALLMEVGGSFSVVAGGGSIATDDGDFFGRFALESGPAEAAKGVGAAVADVRG